MRVQPVCHGVRPGGRDVRRPCFCGLIGAAAEVVVLQVALIVSRARHHGGGRSAAVREVVQQAVTLGGDGRGSATLDISK